MKPFIKAILFLVVLTFFDFLLRKGMIGLFIPFSLPQQYSVLLLFTLFAVFSWIITARFCRIDKINLVDLGVSFDQGNRWEFLYGFLVGAVLWAIVSLTQSQVAGFSWVMRPDVDFMSILYGFVFIFIADLGTELYTRGYPLSRFRESFGAKSAIVIMVFFVALKSISFEAEGPLLFYSILIPAVHTVFFSIIYFKTRRLGAALGVHTGANFVTISIFDLRTAQPGQAIPAGIFQSDVDLEALSIDTLQLPWVGMAVLFSIVTYYWWKRK